MIMYELLLVYLGLIGCKAIEKINIENVYRDFWIAEADVSINSFV
jgi:hypothetical protein